MKIDRVDLYKYFGVEKPKGANGILNSYIIEPCEEMGLNRLRPAMIVTGGGAYYGISDREKEPIALHFLAKGFDAFVLEYSVYPLSYPHSLMEGFMAIAYIRENADNLGIDKEHIAVAGFSAGGHLAGMLATLFEEDCVKKALGERAKICRPDAVVLAYPVITSGEFEQTDSIFSLSGGDKKLAEQLALEKRVNEKSAPAFIWATTEDKIVPVENSFLMATAYRKHNVPFELHIFEKGEHGLSLATKETQKESDSVKAWLTLCEVWLKNRGFDISYKGE